MVLEASFVIGFSVDAISLVSLKLGMEKKGIHIPMEATRVVQMVKQTYRVYHKNTPPGSLRWINH